MVQYDDIIEPLPDANLLKNIDIYKEKLSKKDDSCDHPFSNV